MKNANSMKDLTIQANAEAHVGKHFISDEDLDALAAGGSFEQCAKGIEGLRDLLNYLSTNKTLSEETKAKLLSEAIAAINKEVNPASGSAS